MIDFSQYSEVDPFITPDLKIENPGKPRSDFKEDPFEDKREKYIEFLKNKELQLLDYINKGIYGYIANTDTTYLNKYKDALEITNILKNDTPSSYFGKYKDKDASGNCLGTGVAYNLFRKMPEYASRITAISIYEEYFEDLFKLAWDTVNQIFNKIGTRGQFYGYLDQQVKGYGNILTQYITDDDNYKDILTNISSHKTSIINAHNQFKTNIIAAATDMRTIVEPVVKFINYIELGSSIVMGSMGVQYSSETLHNVLDEFGREVYNYGGDYHLNAQGSTYQITKQVGEFTDPAKANFEMMYTKAVKLSLNEADLYNRITQLANEFVIPNYG